MNPRPFMAIYAPISERSIYHPPASKSEAAFRIVSPHSVDRLVPNDTLLRRVDELLTRALTNNSECCVDPNPQDPIC